MSSLGNKQAKLKNKLQSILSFNENIEVPQVNSEISTPIFFILDLLSIITPSLDNIINKLFDDNFKNINQLVKIIIYENLILNIEDNSVNNILFSIEISDIDVLELYNKDYRDLVHSKFYGNDVVNKTIRDIIFTNSESNILNKGLFISRDNNRLNVRIESSLDYKSFLYNIIFDNNFVILDKDMILSEITKFTFNYTQEENTESSILTYLKFKELINNIESDKEDIFNLNKYNKFDDKVNEIIKGTFTKKLGVFNIEKKVNNIYFFKLFNSNDYINSFINIDTNSDLIKDLNKINKLTSSLKVNIPNNTNIDNISSDINTISKYSNEGLNKLSNSNMTINNIKGTTSNNTNVNNNINDINNAANSVGNATNIAVNNLNKANQSLNTLSNFNVQSNSLNNLQDDTINKLNDSLNELQNSAITNLTKVSEPLSIVFKYKILTNFINTITLRSVLDPKIKLLFSMNQYIRNGEYISQKDIILYSQNYETLIKKITNELNKNFICFLFKILKKEILKILKKILTAIIKEKLIAYKNIYLSLLLPRRDSTNNFQI
jgi:hypothetical protein